MKKIIARVPENTIPYKCGDRFMACTVTDGFEYIGSVAYFRSHSEAVEWVKENPDYKMKSME